MPDFTTFKEDHPIIRDVPISSGAEGTEKLGEVFGQIAHTGLQVAEKIHKEYQDALVLHDSNRILELTNQAKVDMALQPNHSAAIAKQTDDTIKSLLSTVDPSAREKVRHFSEVHMGSVNIEAAKHTFRQNNIKLLTSYLMELPQSYETLKHTMDPEEFERRSKILLTPAQDLTQARIMSPSKYVNISSTIQAIQKNHEALIRLSTKENITAQKYSQSQNYSFTDDETNLADRPSDLAHDYIQEHNEVERNYSHAVAQAKRGIIDVQSFIDLTPDQVQVISAHLDGAAKAKSYLQTDAPYAFVQQRINELKENPSKTHEEEAEFDVYTSWDNALKNGDSQKVRLETIRGAQDFREYNSKRTAVEELVFNAPTQEQANMQKQEMLNKIDNDYVASQVAQDDAKGIPANHRSYLPPVKMIPIQSSFKAGADVMPGINSIYSLPKDQQYWATSSLSDPIQKAAVWGVAGRRNVLPEGQPADIWSIRAMKAAQPIPPELSKNLQLGKEGEKEADVRLSVQSKLGNTLNFMSQIPEGDAKTGPQWMAGSVDLGVNYVKNRMLETGDYKGSNVDKYIDEFTAGYNANYKLYSGMNYSFNLNEVNLSQDQVDYLSYYKLNEFRKESANVGGKVTAGLAQDLMHVQVVNTRDGEVAVVSPDGTILSHERITPGLLSAARKSWEENEKAVTQEMVNQSDIFDPLYGDLSGTGKVIPKSYNPNVTNKRLSDNKNSEGQKE